MSAHTPGPWKALISKAGRATIFTDEHVSERWMIAEVSREDDDPNDPRSRADAHLIAAAPEMYESLRWAEAMLTSMRERVPAAALDSYDIGLQKIRTALRVATEG